MIFFGWRGCGFRNDSSLQIRRIAACNGGGNGFKCRVASSGFACYFGRSRLQTMSDENKYNDDEKNPKKGGEFRVPPRTWIVWIAIFGGIITLMLVKDKMEAQGDSLKQYKFQQLVDSKQIAEATINYSPQNGALTEITGKYYRTDVTGARIKK